jgi:hypothetical protein
MHPKNALSYRALSIAVSMIENRRNHRVRVCNILNDHAGTYQRGRPK